MITETQMRKIKVNDIVFFCGNPSDLPKLGMCKLYQVTEKCVDDICGNYLKVVDEDGNNETVEGLSTVGIGYYMNI
jgi:hypothetical protein